MLTCMLTYARRMLTYADVGLHLYTGASAEDEHDDEEEREREREEEMGEREREREREEEEESESERERVQDAWVEKGRRQGDFVGNLLSADARTSACTRPRLFGRGACTDGAKVP